MENNLINLRESENLVDRQFYAKSVKKIAELYQTVQNLAERNLIRVSAEDKENLKQLKIHLSNYDIYKQKIKCSYCQEVECLCYEINRGNQTMSPELQQINEGRQSGLSENMESIRRTNGDNSSSPGSNENIELPF